MVEGDHVPGADRLRRLPEQRARVRARDREAARHRGPREGDVDANAALRAEPDPLAPRLPRHRRARAGCDLDVLVLLPRARPDPRPLRDGRGTRMHTRYFQTGGLAEDIPRGFYPRGAQVRRVDAEGDRRLRGAPLANEIWLERTKGIGLLSADDAIALGQSGPMLRASGVDWDLRKAEPYLAYDQVEFDVPVYDGGDVYDRYKVRVDEMRESTRIVEQCLDRLEQMQGEPWIADDRKVVLPPRHELHTSMESLIHHFKIVTEGYRVPEGEVYVAIESPRGESGCYVVSDGGAEAVARQVPRAVVRRARGDRDVHAERARRRPDRDRRLARLRDGRHRQVSDRRVRRDPGDRGPVPRLALGGAARRCGSRRSATAGSRPRGLPRGRRRARPDARVLHGGRELLRHVPPRAASARSSSRSARTSRARSSARSRCSRRSSRSSAIRAGETTRGRRGHAADDRVRRRLRLGDGRRDQPPLPRAGARRGRARRSWRSCAVPTRHLVLAGAEERRPDAARRLPRSRRVRVAREGAPDGAGRRSSRRSSPRTSAAAAAPASRWARRRASSRRAPASPTYLVVNADESEPGTFKDREIMFRVPHRLIEGCLITAHAIESKNVFIYIRGEYLHEFEVLRAALDQVRKAKLLDGVTIVLHRGAGAYICGEETALLESLEGKRGQPRSKPPFPAVQGLYASPSLINNVETIATVPIIIEHGRRRVRQDRRRELGRHTRLLALGQRRERRQLRAAARHAAPRADLRHRRRDPGRPRAEGRHPGRLVRAGADRRRRSTRSSTSTRWRRRRRCSAPAR